MLNFKRLVLLSILLPYTSYAETVPDFFQGVIAYMDHLRSCVPYTFSYQNPFMPNAVSQNVIRGRSGNHCLVTMQTGPYTWDCSFSPEAISVMTSDAKYSDARNNTLSGSSDDLPSYYLRKECKFVVNGVPEN